MAEATPELTPRQMEIFSLLAKGLSNPDISRVLDISVNTVKIHVAAILRELNVANRTEAAAAFRSLLGEESKAGRDAQLAQEIGRPRIAVMPFTEIGSDDDTAHFSAGLVEELITCLSSWRWFPVISRGSTIRFGSDDLDLVAVSEKLQAKYLITGTIRRTPHTVRVTAHLLDAEAGEEVWVDSFQNDLVDLLVAQADLARQIVAQLAPSLLRTEGTQTERRPLSEYSVWDLTCRGMWLKNQGTRGATEEALNLFDQALTVDPRFTMAYYGRARTHHSAMYDQWTEDHDVSLAAMQADVGQCLQLEPDNPFSHYIAGLLNVVLGERDSTIAHLNRAVTLNPSFASAVSLLGQMHGMAGRLDECIALLEEALLLNPHGRVSWSYHGAIGTAQYVADRYDESIRALKLALSDRPDSPAELLSLAAAYVENGQADKARETISFLEKRRPEFSFKEHMKVFAAVADPDLVQKQVDALARIDYRAE